MYNWKRWPELAWAVGIAVIVVLATTAVSFEPETIVNWQTWAVGVGGACVRAVGVALLAVFKPS